MSPKDDQASQSHEPVNESHEDKGSHQSDNESEEPKEKSKYDRGGKHPIIGLIIFAVLQFIALLFVVVATPIAMFKINDTWRTKLYPSADTSKSLCVTAWGMKMGCNERGYYNRDFTHTFCYRVRVDFKIVEAFCIMTIGSMVFGLVLGCLAICQLVTKSTTGAIAAFSMVVCLVPWAVMAAMYHQKPCCETSGWNTDAKVTDCAGNNTNFSEDVPRFKEMGSYGAGFALLVTAWALQLVAMIFSFVPL